MVMAGMCVADLSVGAGLRFAAAVPGLVLHGISTSNGRQVVFNLLTVIALLLYDVIHRYGKHSISGSLQNHMFNILPPFYLEAIECHRREATIYLRYVRHRTEIRQSLR